MIMYEDPEIIKNNIKNIQNFIEQDEYKKLKTDNHFKYIDELKLIFFFIC